MMKTLHLHILLLCLALPVSAVDGVQRSGIVEARSSNETVERQAVFDRVQAAIVAKDYAGLNQMASEFRTRRSRTPSGIWKLATFHAALEYYLHHKDQGGQCAYTAGPFLKAWADTDPGQPAAYIAEATLLLDHAWCFRGTGFANKVADAAWAPFKANVAAAYQVLATHKRVAAVDPQFYSAMEDIYIVQGRDKIEFRALLDEASNREPYYYDIYFTAFRYYQPRWYGSDREVDDLARLAADRTKAQDGLGAYARVYWAMANCTCRIDRTAIDWPTMKMAMHDVVDRYPNDWNAASFAKISCRMADSGEAAKYFAMLTVDDGSVWREKVEWQVCQTFAKSYKSEKPQ